MSEQREKPVILPTSLFFAMFVCIYLGWDMIVIPSQALGHLRNNCYLGLFVTALIYLPFFWIAADFIRIFPGESIIMIFRRALGRLGGAIFGIILLFQCIVVIYSALTQAKLMIITYFFVRTPDAVVIGVFILAGLYLALKGVTALGRLAGFILIPPYLLICLLVVLGLNNINPLNIRPIWTGTPMQWLGTGIGLLNPLLPAIGIFFYLQYLRGPKKTLRASLLALGVVFPIFFLLILGSIGAFGYQVVKQIAWPGIEFFHIIDFPLLLLEQAGLIFIVTWYSLQFFAASQAFFITGAVLSNLWPKIPLRTAILLSTAIFFFLALLPVNLVVFNDTVKRFQNPIIISNLILYLITWSVVRIRWRKAAKPF